MSIICSIASERQKKNEFTISILLKKPYLRYLSTRKSLVIREAFLSIFRKVGVFQQNQYQEPTPTNAC